MLIKSVKITNGFFMYFEEFEVGDKFSTRSRPVTGTDIDTFAALTGATNPLFMNDEFGKKLGYKGRITPGVLTLSLAVGLLYSVGLFDHIRAFLGVDKLRFLTSVNPGDTIRCRAEVVNKRDIKKDSGIVAFRWDCENQGEKPVLEAEATFMMQKKP